MISTGAGRGRGGGERHRWSKIWEFFFLRFLFYSLALSCGEEGHSERSLSFTTRPELDCAYYILVINSVNMGFLLLTPVEGALLSISLQLPPSAINAKYKFK